MSKYKLLFILPICLSIIGCAALFAKQEYVLIEQEVTEKPIFHGVIFSIPEKAHVRKVRLVGVGKYQNIEISVRIKQSRWQLKKKVHGGITFPYDVFISAETDAIKIIKPVTTGSGRIDTVEFYTITDVK